MICMTNLYKTVGRFHSTKVGSNLLAVFCFPTHVKNAIISLRHNNYDLHAKNTRCNLFLSEDS